MVAAKNAIAPSFVLDASVAIGWLIPPQNTPYKTLVLESLSQHKALVPPLWHLEMANILARHVLAGKLDSTELESMLMFIKTLPVQTASKETTWLPDIVQMAIEHKLSSYDAVYLRLAQRMALPLATVDEVLIAAAKRARVALYAPRKLRT